ncbi:unnamed protein product [Pelagomonas calceolata]|uniref:Protein kinase domain-containing protein n=1 Tax=Pelagomonas calceolata TaxID=35677 RepID=A0A8J2SRS6_9STRA|nr:unnamed protein product [Pelagomonas calceolata]
MTRASRARLLEAAPPPPPATAILAQRRRAGADLDDDANVLQHLARACFRLARIVETSIRLGALATPLVLAVRGTAPLRRFDEDRWWRYCLWATRAAGPTAVKLAQWASSREDRFPRAFCDRFAHLQDRAPAHAWRDTERALEASLGPDWRDVLDVDAAPVGTGCVAQKDVTNGGRRGDRVAVKVVHPAARRRVASDLDFLRACARAGEALIPRANTATRDQPTQEADNLERLRENFRNQSSVSFPAPRRALVSEDVLVEDFVEGPSMREYLKRDVDDARRKALARVGVDAVCKMIFHDNLLHGDLHPGNILVTRDATRDPAVCFLDAGICVELGAKEHVHLVRVLSALMRHDGDAAGRLLCKGMDGARALNNGFGTDEAWQRAQDSFCECMRDITSRSVEEEFFNKYSEYASRIFAEAEKCRVALEGFFVSTAVAIRVMEGVANALDPDVPIGQLALKWIASSPYVAAGLTRS